MALFERLVQRTHGIASTEFTVTHMGMSDLITELCGVRFFGDDPETSHGTFLSPSLPVQPDGEMPQFDIFQNDGLSFHDQERFVPDYPEFSKLLFELQKILVEVTQVKLPTNRK